MIHASLDASREVSEAENAHPQQSGYETPTPEDESSDHTHRLNGLLPPPLPLTSSEDSQGTSVSIESEIGAEVDAPSWTASTGLTPSEGLDTTPHHQPLHHPWIGGEGQVYAPEDGHEHETNPEEGAFEMPNGVRADLDAEMATEDTLESRSM